MKKLSPSTGPEKYEWSEDDKARLVKAMETIFPKDDEMSDTSQCSSCGGFCGKKCQRENYQETTMTDKLITQEQLAERWLLSEATLERDRSLKQGVKYLKLGGLIRYRLQDVLDYEQQCTVETKPSTLKKAKP